ncbi:Peroxidase [Musa troglodytarum]|uniref:Peroxidase n=1 Tax=Musa troglodytarum TaxID=320322 RepID=A0A9E7HYC4_9LILI|nr:Peroxidase [Musa troglodytarum]
MACNHRPPCLLAFFFFAAIASAQLSSTFYSTSCPLAIQTIRQAVRAAVAKEARMGASLLRLHFHDCFVNGCDGSVLLDDTPSFTGEKTAVPNNNSLRGFDVIDNIKSQVEAVCKQVVSCADILAVAARESVAALGGPPWTVQLGRRDATTASLDAANTEIPSPKSDLDDLISAYSKKGLSTTDMVALSGAHTIGQARCISFRDRIYNETSIDSSLATSRQSNCPSSGGGDALRQLLLQELGEEEGPAALGPAAVRWRIHRLPRHHLFHEHGQVLQRLRCCNGEDGEHKSSHRHRRRGQAQLQEDQLRLLQVRACNMQKG